MSRQVFRGASFDITPVQRFSRRPSKIGIAIDFATTRQCIATGQLPLLEDHNLAPPDVKLYTCWPDSYEAGSKWPITAMLYGSQGLPMTGNDLEMAFKKPASRNFDMDKHFRQWKLLFHDDQSDPTTKRIQEELTLKLNRLGKNRLELLQDWVELIYTALLIPQGDGTYSLKDSIGCFSKEDIEIIVTVPPGRSVLAHDEVHRAFIQAPIGKGQVFLVSEPEAMFRSWIQGGADPDDFKVGGRYLVVDGGGGTCCIVRFLLDRLKPSLGFEQEFESESLVCGAESISNLVEEKLGKKIPLDTPNRVWVLDKFRRQFDEYFKRRFGADDDATYNFEVANLECELSRQEIAACFDTCIEKLFKTIDRHSSRGLPVKFLVLGGGLFESPYVKRAVEMRYSNLKICRLSADKGHVARGAVLVRACAPFIIRRPILRSKAVTTFVEVTDAIRRSPVFANLYIKKDQYKGDQWCLAAQWLAKQGTEAKIKHANDMYEVASEATFADARKRFFDLDEEDLTFSDTVLTFNHTPPDNEELLYQLKDGKWATLDGCSISPPEGSEKLTWDPKEIGINLNTLEISYDCKRIKVFRVLRYAIQMQMREVGTKYWVKTWSWTKAAKTKGRVRQVLLSEAHEHKALFAPQEISQNLAASYDLGPGMRKEAGNGDEESETSSELSEGFKRPSAVGSLDAAPRIASPSGNESIAAVHQSATGTNMLAASASIRSDLSSANSSHYKDRHPLRTVRPTQRHSIEGSAKYSLGAPRNNGGCWTCSFRNVRCHNETPRCNECASLGLVCEYGRPAWLYNDALEQVQRETNKRLIKEHKALLAQRRQSLDRICQIGVPRPVSHSNGSQRLTAMVAALTKPAQHSTAENISIAGSHTLVRRKGFVSKTITPLQRRNLSPAPDKYDIYDFDPPASKRPRIFEPEPEEDIGGNEDNGRRRSRRQREPTAQSAGMVPWEDIDAETYDVESETAELE